MAAKERKERKTETFFVLLAFFCGNSGGRCMRFNCAGYLLTAPLCPSWFISVGVSVSDVKRRRRAEYRLPRVLRDAAAGATEH